MKAIIVHLLAGMGLLVPIIAAAEPTTGPANAIQMDQQWVEQMRPGTAGVSLQIAKNPDGSESADLAIRDLGCVGGVNGLIERHEKTFTLVSDRKQQAPACKVTFKYVGKHLVSMFATSDCSDSGGVGCTANYGPITLHRIEDISDSSSSAGMYYYIRHRKQ